MFVNLYNKEPVQTAPFYVNAAPIDLTNQRGSSIERSVLIDNRLMELIE